MELLKTELLEKLAQERLQRHLAEIEKQKEKDEAEYRYAGKNIDRVKNEVELLLNGFVIMNDFSYRKGLHLIYIAGILNDRDAIDLACKFLVQKCGRHTYYHDPSAFYPKSNIKG